MLPESGHLQSRVDGRRALAWNKNVDVLAWAQVRSGVEAIRVVRALENDNPLAVQTIYHHPQCFFEDPGAQNVGAFESLKFPRRREHGWRHRRLSEQKR